LFLLEPDIAPPAFKQVSTKVVKASKSKQEQSKSEAMKLVMLEVSSANSDMKTSNFYRGYMDRTEERKLLMHIIWIGT